MELPHQITCVTLEKAQGWVVVDVLAKQVASVHLYSDSREASEVAKGMNDAYLIKAHWPDADDADVIELLNDESFVPIGQTNVDVLDSPVYRLHQAAEAIARQRAGIE